MAKKITLAKNETDELVARLKKIPSWRWRLINHGWNRRGSYGGDEWEILEYHTETDTTNVMVRQKKSYTFSAVVGNTGRSFKGVKHSLVVSQPEVKIYGSESGARGLYEHLKKVVGAGKVRKFQKEEGATKRQERPDLVKKVVEDL